MRISLPIFFILFSFKIVQAQELKLEEPEFVGQALLIKADGTFETLEKTPVRASTKAKLSVKSMMSGGTYSTNLLLDGCCSAIKTDVENGLLKIIIRVSDNKRDPVDVLQIIQFTQSKRERSAEVFSFNGIRGADEGSKLKRASFYGKKYGEASYLLSVSVPGPGEYGIFPADGQAPRFISTFSIK